MNPENPSSTVTCTTHHEGQVWHIQINRAEVRNCVDRPTAESLHHHFVAFEQDGAAKVAILSGAGAHFCAGADLKAVASGDPGRVNRLEPEGPGPMGISRLQLSKPTIAAISGYCVAGGLELALWCDLRVADYTAVMGVYCRRFGVPLIDGGTVRLPRLIGQSRALDMILSGRGVGVDEAIQWGLINRVSEDAWTEAMTLAQTLCALPQTCLRNDRMSTLLQWGLTETEALTQEFQLGLRTLNSGETFMGASKFAAGAGRAGLRLDE